MMRRVALSPEQRRLKQQYLVQQARGIPPWASVWKEIKAREIFWDIAIEKEAKQQARYADQDGAFDPPDAVVEQRMRQLDPQMWSVAKRKPDIYDRLWAGAFMQLEDEFDREVDALKPKIERELEAQAKQDYLRLVDHLRRLDGKPCWRAIWLPCRIDPRQHNNLGPYWSERREGAQPYFTHRNVDFTTHQLVLYEGVVDIDYVDWRGTAGARAVEVYGEREQEVRFVKHAPIHITKAYVHRSNKQWIEQTPDVVLTINATRYC